MTNKDENRNIDIILLIIKSFNNYHHLSNFRVVSWLLNEFLSIVENPRNQSLYTQVSTKKRDAFAHFIAEFIGDIFQK